MNKKVVIIGLDGLDPKILEEGFENGYYPNLKKLKDFGSYSVLQTVMPPQSPVAWASFTTGSLPSKHKIYDFITRNPENYGLDLTSSGSEAQNIESVPFWEITSKNNINSRILFLPNTFPPSKLKGQMLSGMGTPDILGTAGTFTLFSSEEKNLDPKWRGKFIKVTNQKNFQTQIEGPKYKVFKDTKTSKINLKLSIVNDREIKISVNNQKLQLIQGQFSDWVEMTFKIDFFTKYNGIAKFYLKSVSPQLELYLSPINHNPMKPSQSISYPKDYSQKIAKKYGKYSTLGLPHDTWALEEDIFDEQAFLTQAKHLSEKRSKILLSELENFNHGLYFGYLGTTDTIQHMFWRFLKDERSIYQNTIEEYYQKADDFVGKVANRLDEDDTLIILSDHGFASFDYEINLNTWLVEKGYHKLKEGKSTGEELFQDTDWSQTQAYAAGYNGIFLNLKDREKHGIVSKASYDDFVKEISSKLLSIKNPHTQQPVIKHVYSRDELGIDESDNLAPDLIVGFHKGIRSSWDTAVGSAPENIINSRNSKWSGDHLFDYKEVPAVLFINKKVQLDNPSIIDIIPSALSLFGINDINTFDGKSFF